MLQQPTQISFQTLEGFLDSAWVLAAYQALNSSTGLQSECSAILVLFKEIKIFHSPLRRDYSPKTYTF